MFGSKGSLSRLMGVFLTAVLVFSAFPVASEGSSDPVYNPEATPSQSQADVDEASSDSVSAADVTFIKDLPADPVVLDVGAEAEPIEVELSCGEIPDGLDLIWMIDLDGAGFVAADDPAVAHLVDSDALEKWGNDAAASAAFVPSTESAAEYVLKCALIPEGLDPQDAGELGIESSQVTVSIVDPAQGDAAEAVEAESDSIFGAEVQALTDEQADDDLEIQQQSQEASSYTSSAADNMAIVDADTPTDPSSTAAIWDIVIDGAGEGVVSQLVVGSIAYIFTGSRLIAVDTQSGGTLAMADTAGQVGAATPVCSDDVLVVILADGRVQAFRVSGSEIESIWIHDPGSGSRAVSLDCSSGLLYVVTSGQSGSIFIECISLDDQDASQSDESPQVIWSGSGIDAFSVGFGQSALAGDWLLVVTEDSQGGQSILSLNASTGEIASSMSVDGEVSGDLVYDSAESSVYYSLESGSVCKVSLADDGTLAHVDTAMLFTDSPSTPVVYDGRVYVGSDNPSTVGGMVSCIDSESMDVLFSVAVKSRIGSLVLSIGHESEGFLCLYAAYTNSAGIALIVVSNDPQTAADATFYDLYDASAFADYGITDIAADAAGALIFMLNNGYLVAVGIPTVALVIALIASIGDVTLESGTAIDFARSSYDALDTDSKRAVSASGMLTVLRKAEEVYEELRADVDRVIALIDSIGAVTSEKKDLIEATRASYDSLDNEQKAAVTNYQTLVLAENQLAEIIGGDDGDGSSASGGSNGTSGASGGEGSASEGGGSSSVVASTRVISSLIEVDEGNVLADEDTGVEVSGVPDGIELIVEPIESAEIESSGMNDGIGSYAVLSGWRIRLVYTSTGLDVEEVLRVGISVPAPDDVESYQGVTAIRYSDSGDPEFIDCTVSGGRAEWTSNGVGSFALAGSAAPDSSLSSPALVEETEELTGSVSIMTWVTVGVVALLVLALLVVWRILASRKRDDDGATMAGSAEMTTTTGVADSIATETRSDDSD